MMKHILEYNSYQRFEREDTIMYLDACRDNNVTIVEEFVNAGMYPAKEIYGYYTDGRRNWQAIEIACQEGSTEVVEYLLTLEEIDPFLHSNLPFRLAAYNNHVKVVELIINQEDFNFNDGNVDYTFVSTIVSNGMHEMAELILNKFDVNIQYSAGNGKSALDVAALNNDTKMFKLLFKYLKPVDRAIDDKATISAINAGNLELFNMMFYRPETQAFDSFNWFLSICKHRSNFEIFKILYDHPKSDPSDHNWNFFRESCYLDFPDRINYMLNISDVDIDPSINRNEGIARAAEYNRTENMKILMADPRVDPSDSNNRALVKACISNKLEATELLLSDERVKHNISSILFPTMKTYHTALTFSEFPPMLIAVLIEEFELEDAAALNQFLTIMKETS